MVADREGKELAKQFIAETCQKEGIVPGQLNIHMDRGAAMIAKPLAFLLADLGVTKTHSRPHTSDDNPFSESHFKTLKYRPDFPDRFGSQQDALEFLHTAHPELGGDQPLDAARTELGARQVEEVLWRMEYGLPA